MSNDVGRPTVITPDVVSLLVASFHSGLTVREACWQSGISHEAYYSRLRSDEQFADTMAKAQSQVTINARTQIANSIKAGDTGLAKWWLERKAKDEFGQKEVIIQTESIPSSGASENYAPDTVQFYKDVRSLVALECREKRSHEYFRSELPDAEKHELINGLNDISDEELCRQAVEEYDLEHANIKNQT